MSRCDVAIVGAGAAGLAAAIAARRASDLDVVLFEGAKAPGAKILVSGGSRCNVTNVEVTEADFSGGTPALIRRVLRAWTTEDTVGWFRDLGVALHEEPGGKLFPDSNRARDVVTALLRETGDSGVSLRAGTRVQSIDRTADGFVLETSAGPCSARALVLATGGLSLPKTGSDGWGYDAARRLGHTIVPTTPALAPMVVGGPQLDFCRRLSGVSLRARLDLRVSGRVARSIDGSLLWTHFGISGPAALDLSRHWHRARLDAEDAVAVTVSSCPESSFESLEAHWLTLARDRPKTRVHTAVSTAVPDSMAQALTEALGVDGETSLADLSRDVRRRIIHALTDWPLVVDNSRGYNYAEVTAGGVDLGEVDMRSMASRVCQGLYLVGEVLDVDGRLGGFNFQWAWATAHIAGRALARDLRPSSFPMPK